MPRKGLNQDKILHTFWKEEPLHLQPLRYLMSHEIGSGTGWRYLLHSEDPWDAQKSHWGFSVSIIFFCILLEISQIILHNIFSCNIQNICNIFCTVFFSSLSPAELSPNHRPISKWSGPSGLLRNISMLTTHCTLTDLGKYSLNIL